MVVYLRLRLQIHINVTYTIILRSIKNYRVLIVNWSYMVKYFFMMH